jgi:hypothetical protein
MESSGEEDEKAEWNCRDNGNRGSEEKGKPPLPTTFKSAGTIPRAPMGRDGFPLKVNPRTLNQMSFGLCMQD